ncbi:DHA2 family efflux MFS transporter permease subunit [Dictyobacter formicarum]|uniref:MFS transporter n=1 Tax=Dictyobacter formicarum TaxID=2778368 RepID=A0ABQ3VJR2_9CHLR|nr:DHA2 family efflux MFS transporter permease subunit [Dictyobacter formicarum]GHO85646.1 MFS transporter [Dictyobacter formicarum]
MQMSAPAAPRSGGLPYKWIVACVVIFGIFMSILDSTIVNIAIPRLQSAFGSDLNSVQWVLTGYTLAQGVATPLTAYLSDRIGIKRFYMLSLAGFTLGSALCGLAWSLPVLIAFRLLQGFMGAFLSPLAITLLYREFAPSERGTAMGVLGIPILLAPAFGPTLGGYIVTFAGWQLIFYINVPLGIIGLILAAIYIHEARADTHASFDISGFVLSAIGLGLLLYGLSDASTSGWTSGLVLGCLISGGLLLVIFIFVELSRARQGLQPLLDVRVFKDHSFSTSSFASILVTFALFGGLFLVPVYLQNLRQLSAFQAGLLLLPQAFASMIAVVVGGRLVDRLGVRAVVIPGLIITAIAMWRFTFLDLYIPYTSFQLLLILRGFGIGLCMQPLMVSALAQIRPRMLAQATAVSTTLRFVGSSLAVAIVATLVQSRTSLHYAHLAEKVTPDSPLGQLVPRLQALFISHGASTLAAYGTALSTISGLVRRQAYILAIQDAFWLSLVLTLVAVVAAFFVSSGRRKNEPVQQEPLNDEEAKAREEAMMAV